MVWLWWCGIRVQVEALVQAPEDGCINNQNMLSIKSRNNKASDINLVSLYSIILQYSQFNSYLQKSCCGNTSVNNYTLKYIVKTVM